MKIRALVQGSAKWLDWRTQGVGASELSVILGVNPYQTEKELWEIKTGLKPAPNLNKNPHVIRGKRDESKARLAAEKYFFDQTSCRVMLLPIVAEHDHYDYVKASFDGIDLNVNSPIFNVPVELKCPCESVWKEIQKNGDQSHHYAMYSIQVHQQMQVSGAQFGYLIFWFKGKILPFKILRDDVFFEMALKRITSFQQCVAKLVPPKDDPTRDIYQPKGDERTKWEALHTKYRTNECALKTAPNDEKLLEQKFKLRRQASSILGVYRSGQVDDFRITRTVSHGKVDHESQLNAILLSLKQRGIELSEYLIDERNFTSEVKSQLRITKSKPLAPPKKPTPKPRHTISVSIH